MFRVSHKRTKLVLVTLLVICICLAGIPTQGSRASSVKDLDPPFETVMTNVGNYIFSVDTKPDYSSTWNVIGLIRSGRVITQEYKDTYYENTVRYLQDNDWQITRAKYSDYSKLILGMTVIGKDATDISGHNLLEYLSDFKKVTLQGLNGPIWALIALKSHPSYSIPQVSGVSEQTTEEGLISYLLSKQLKEPGKEGWNLLATGTTPDTDITGMTIQALSPYYGKRDDVTEAVDKALEWLSSAQNEQGGYSTLNGDSSVETSESDVQVIVALSSIGLDCQTDQRFIKSEENWVMSRLFDYYSPLDSEKGGFLHVLEGADNNGGGVAGSIDGMATEQGMYALASYHRLLEGQNALYDMSDIEVSPGESVEPSKPDATTEKQEDTTKSSSGTTQAKKTKKKIKVKAVYIDYRQISLQKGKTRTLRAIISPSNASNKKVKWTSSNRKVATVTQKGIVKGIKAGNANITATATDGSKRKASCKVIVYSQNSGNKTSYAANGGSNNATRYIYPTTGSQGNSSGNYYYPVVNSGQTSGQTSGSGSTATSNSSSTSTEAGAWTFDGETYKADSGDTTGETDAGLDEEDYDAEMDEDEEDEEFLDEESEDEISEHKIQLPTWLAICLGILIPGGLAAGFRLPWNTLRKRMMTFLASHKKK